MNMRLAPLHEPNSATWPGTPRVPRRISDMAIQRARFAIPQYSGQWSITDHNSRGPYFSEMRLRSLK